MSEVTDKIKSRGYWEVVIRPQPFQEERVPYSELEELVVRTAVRLRGWPVPYHDGRIDSLRGPNWVGQDVDARIVHHTEAWRFFTSGQFSHLRAVSADWRGDGEATPLPDGAARVIEVWEILFYLTEVFELATRLALGPAGDSEMTIRVRLAGLQGRQLVVAQHNRAEFMTPRRATTITLDQGLTTTRDDLVAEGRQQAVRMAREFLLRFGWDAPLDQLTDHQRELTERP